MAELFISYKGERRRAAEHMAAVLECDGYSTWFDYQLVKGSFRTALTCVGRHIDPVCM